LRPVLRAARFNNDSVLYWDDPACILQSADNVAGPWTDVPATAPFPITFTRNNGFYRLRLP
ncbi:MAG TPA: hypothetical protein VN625_11640, partial [Desulfuromonadaceae bacterium]|nr:hypothetical protein [Desulfuromonadaceae bacterium]